MSTMNNQREDAKVCFFFYSLRFPFRSPERRNEIDEHINVEFQIHSAAEVEYQLAQYDESYRTLRDGFCSSRCLRQ